MVDKKRVGVSKTKSTFLAFKSPSSARNLILLSLMVINAISEAVKKAFTPVKMINRNTAVIQIPPYNPE